MNFLSYLRWFSLSNIFHPGAGGRSLTSDRGTRWCDASSNNLQLGAGTRVINSAVINIQQEMFYKWTDVDIYYKWFANIWCLDETDCCCVCSRYPLMIRALCSNPELGISNQHLIMARLTRCNIDSWTQSLGESQGGKRTLDDQPCHRLYQIRETILFPRKWEQKTASLLSLSQSSGHTDVAPLGTEAGDHTVTLCVRSSSQMRRGTIANILGPANDLSSKERSLYWIHFSKIGKMIPN